jgi:uncharacterized protein DUF4154
MLAITLAGCLIAVGAAFAPMVSAQGVEEPKLKAAFLYNFVKFATWPDDLLPAGAPIVLCAADDGIATLLESEVAGRSVDSHALVVKRVKLNASARGCAMLYVGRLDQRRAKELFTVLDGTSVLTVGDAEDFATAGGMIGLFVDGGRMKFAINIGAVERTQLRLSAQLLSLAKIIKS